MTNKSSVNKVPFETGAGISQSEYSLCYRLDGPKIKFSCGQEIFLFQEMSSQALGPTQSAMQWLAKFLPGAKKPGYEVNHSLPSCAKVKNEKKTKCLHTLYAFIAWAGKNFTSYLYLLLLESHLPKHC